MKEKIIALINYKVLVTLLIAAFLGYTVFTGNTMSQVFFDLFKSEIQTVPAENPQIVPATTA